MAARRCARCDSENLITGMLDKGMNVCVNHATHHEVRHIGVSVSACQECGHIDLWMLEPAVALAPLGDHVDSVQELDF